MCLHSVLSTFAVAFSICFSSARTIDHLHSVSSVHSMTFPVLNSYIELGRIFALYRACTCCKRIPMIVLSVFEIAYTVFQSLKFKGDAAGRGRPQSSCNICSLSTSSAGCVFWTTVKMLWVVLCPVHRVYENYKKLEQERAWRLTVFTFYFLHLIFVEQYLLSVASLWLTCFREFMDFHIFSFTNA